VALFDKSYTTFYQCTIFDIFDVEKYRDLEYRPNGG